MQWKGVDTLDIKYTYRDVYRPIEKANFLGNTLEIILDDTGNDSGVILKEGFTLNKRSFADFTALVNRINKQING
ncbi:MAG: hypothetical protein WCX48_11895 [Bacteroidales bacterium]